MNHSFGTRDVWSTKDAARAAFRESLASKLVGCDKEVFETLCHEIFEDVAFQPVNRATSTPDNVWAINNDESYITSRALNYLPETALWNGKKVGDGALGLFDTVVDDVRHLLWPLIGEGVLDDNDVRFIGLCVAKTDDEVAYSTTSDLEFILYTVYKMAAQKSTVRKKMLCEALGRKSPWDAPPAKFVLRG